VAALRALATGIPLRRLGAVGGAEIAVGPARVSVSDAFETFERALPKMMNGGR